MFNRLAHATRGRVRTSAMPAPVRVRQFPQPLMPQLRAYRPDPARDADRAMLAPRTLSESEIEWISWNASGQRELKGTDALQAFMENKLWCMQALRHALSEVAARQANDSTRTVLPWLLEAAEAIGRVFGQSPSAIGVSKMPEDVRVSWRPGQFDFSPDALIIARHGNGFSLVMRDMVELALAASLFGPEKARTGMTSLDCREQRMIADWLDQLCLQTEPVAATAADVRAARSAMERTPAHLHAELRAGGQLLLDQAAPHDSASRRRLPLSGWTLDLPCSVQALQQAMRAGGLELGAMLPPDGISIAWRGLQYAMHDEGGQLFGSYNCGLADPSTPGELLARLHGFSCWWVKLAARMETRT